MTTRYAATEDDLAGWIEGAGAPRYRVDQVFDALYRQRIPLEDASSLPRALRTELAEAFPLALDPIVESTGDDGETVKWLWRCRSDGAQIETVLMRYPERATVCVSSQAGCAMGCTFCATGQAGFVRHLDAGEIVEQVVRAAHASPQPVNNVVFMGMGEPLANYDATWAAVERLHGDLGLSARHITISTVGDRARHPAARDRVAAGHARDLAARARRRAAQHDDPDQPPVPARRGDGRRRGARRLTRPAGHVRVRLHRRRQRPARARPRARPAAPPARAPGAPT